MFLTQGFNEQSLRALSDAINAFLAANPTFTAHSISVTTTPESLSAILLYETP